jgi:hypothetical protein
MTPRRIPGGAAALEYVRSRVLVVSFPARHGTGEEQEIHGVCHRGQATARDLAKQDASCQWRGGRVPRLTSSARAAERPAGRFALPLCPVPAGTRNYPARRCQWRECRAPRLTSSQRAAERPAAGSLPPCRARFRWAPA